jgi:ABC-2 type transport system permease protein
MNLKRYLTIYAALWKTSVTREMSFKGNFLLWIVVELAWFGLQLAFVGVIFSQTTTVGTWTVWQVVLLTGTSNFIQEIYQAFFLVNCTNLSELVRTGKMDFLLLLPVNTRFLVSTRQVDLPSFANAAFAVCVMIYAAGKLHLHPAANEQNGPNPADQNHGNKGKEQLYGGWQPASCSKQINSKNERTSQTPAKEFRTARSNQCAPCLQNLLLTGIFRRVLPRRRLWILAGSALLTLRRVAGRVGGPQSGCLLLGYRRDLHAGQ